MKSKKIVRASLIAGVLLILAGILSFVVFSEGEENELAVYFYPMDGNSDGDSCIIKIGNTEILIDGGSTMSTGMVITKKMQEYCTDKEWDYIIVTHPDYDHIAGFLNENGIWKFIETGDFTVKTLIDFDTSKDDTVSEETRDGFRTLFDKKDEDGDTAEKKLTGYGSYSSERDKLVESKKIKNYYPASLCCWQSREGVQKPENGATNVFDLGILNSAKLKILYNYYYDNLDGTDDAKLTSEAKNLLSVCCLIEYGDHSLLFTGDLMENSSDGKNQLDGETRLLNNNSGVIPQNVTVYKAAHHGSRTSSSQKFIDYIKPKHVVISGCAGGKKYHFPDVTVTDRFLQYTENIYITSKQNEDKKVDYYGDVTFKTDGKTLTVTSTKETQDDGKTPKLITDTDWFKTHRMFNVFTFYGDNNGESNCTLIKYGETEILIDCGRNSTGSQLGLINKVKKYCTDGKIEYTIVSNSQVESIGGLLGDYNYKGEPLVNGLLDVLSIGTLIEFSASNFDLNDPERDGARALERYQEKRQKVKNIILASEAVKVNDGVININDYFSIDILNSKFYADDLDKHDEDDYSVCALITFRGKTFLFMGDITDSAGGIEYLKEHNDNIANVDYYRVPNYGGEESYNQEFLSFINPKFAVLDCMAGMQRGAYPGVEHVKAVEKITNGELYLTGQLIKGQNSEICGDITYTVKYVLGETTILISEGETKIAETQWWKNNAA